MAPQNLPKPHSMPLDELNQSLRNRYFYGGDSGNGPYNDSISISTAAGKPLTTMWRWSMTPAGAGGFEFHEGNADIDYRVSATFDSPQDEHYYGLGQQQQGALDVRDHRVSCWHDYTAVGGENVCVPFLMSSRCYAVRRDIRSKTTIDLGFNQHNEWSSEVGDRVSFFVIAGDRVDKIYQGYRQITGVTHLLPKAAYGYIQSKAIYPTQDQLLAIAKGYRDRHLPLDVLVVDFLNMTKQGEMDLDPARWPDPAGMNRELHSMGINTLERLAPLRSGHSVLRHVIEQGWLVRTAGGTPDRGWYTKEIGPNLDTTNPEAAKWFWESIRDRYVKPYGLIS